MPPLGDHGTHFSPSAQSCKNESHGTGPGMSSAMPVSSSVLVSLEPDSLRSEFWPVSDSVEVLDVPVALPSSAGISRLDPHAAHVRSTRIAKPPLIEAIIPNFLVF